MISIIHPSRGRAKKSYDTIMKWMSSQSGNASFILSLDRNDPSLEEYFSWYGNISMTINENRSAVDAINNAAKIASGGILMVVSDDTECFPNWDIALLKEVEGKTDWILKTQDGIQDWIITMPVMDRAYYSRFGYIYDPDFLHMFCDTWLTVQADISGRKLSSNILFPHLNGSINDDLRKRCDSTWNQGEETFIRKVHATPTEQLKKITDSGMKNWIRQKTGIRI